jgi:hypothetical protein
VTFRFLLLKDPSSLETLTILNSCELTRFWQLDHLRDEISTRVTNFVADQKIGCIVKFWTLNRIRYAQKLKLKTQKVPGIKIANLNVNTACSKSNRNLVSHSLALRNWLFNEPSGWFFYNRLLLTRFLQLGYLCDKILAPLENF